MLQFKPKALFQATILHSTRTDCPKDVADDVEKLLDDHCIDEGCYFHWYDCDAEDLEAEEHYPALLAYLREHEVDYCLIQ